MPTFSVTYEIYTEESAENGDSESSGFQCENVSLREAIDAVCNTDSNTRSQSSIEANDSIENCRWVTVYNSVDWISGETENRSLHIPDSVTASSRKRIARLLGITR